MTVLAHCHGCGDEHPLGERDEDGVTTVCPTCGDTRYESNGRGDSTASSVQRITSVLERVDGVGDAIKRNVLREYSFYAEFEAADVDELMEIPHVGEAIATEIHEAKN